LFILNLKLRRANWIIWKKKLIKIDEAIEIAPKHPLHLILHIKEPVGDRAVMQCLSEANRDQVLHGLNSVFATAFRHRLVYSASSGKPAKKQASIE
jgi:hypothetical protein